MKIAIPVFESGGLESKIYNHFGSAPYFAIVESDDRTIQVVPNANVEHVHGACNPIMALASNHVDAVIVGGIGRNAIMKLNLVGIKVYSSNGPTVGSAVDDLMSDKLDEYDINKSCEGHTV